ncbi:MAG: hypothetical protein AABX10_03440 [Nanoarchaeota archaeon]
MANYETFFPTDGDKYPFEKPYGGFVGASAYHPSVKDIAYPTDPLTANQLKKVSDKINTGTQSIEVSGLGLTGAGPMKHLASIPKQHWKEIDRLRKLTGVDLTFHGPLVESTGFSRGNWSEDQRLEAEKQMKAAVELAQQMNSDSPDKSKNKGIVMTFHSNNGLPEVERKVKVGVLKDGSPDEKIVSMSVYNERTGEIGTLPFTARQDHFEGKEETVTDRLDKFNEEKWTGQIESVFVNSTRANNSIVEAFSEGRKVGARMKEIGKDLGNIENVYKIYDKNYDEYKKAVQEVEKELPGGTEALNGIMANMQNANFFVNESYNQMKEIYNVAYVDAQRRIREEDGEKKKAAEDALKKLVTYRNELKESFEGYKEKSDFVELKKKIEQGTKLLGEKNIRPEIYRPLRDFAVDKSSDTFANVALHAWQNAKHHNFAPGIISIENPPAGMSGLTRAEEIAKLVEKSREKFVKNAVKEKLMSEKEATATAEKMIGATWDVGHINSIQKWGYNRKDVLGQAKKIAPYVKHMHIADNLGFEDAELPAGMGNVPIDEILNAEWGKNFRNAKKAIETGDWFSRQGGMGMTKTPVTEAFSGLTAPVYAVGSMGDAGASYWNSAIMNDGGYFGGLGPINPEIHHSIYGGGFSGLPAYSGGEIPGKASNSSFSGAPLE